MTSDALTSEAIEILDAEAARRIDEIRQHVDFICSSLRAQGNMTINQLLQSVRALTMDEFCNKYHADTNFFLEEQSRKRKGTELMPPNNKRTLTDAAHSDSTLSIKKTPTTKETPSRSLSAKTSLKKDRTTSQTKQQQQQRQEPQKPQQPEQIQQQRQPAEKPTQPKQPPREHQQKQPSDKAVTNGNQPAWNGASKHSGDKGDEEEVEFGPLFMQFLRPTHPKVTFQLDPQEELNQMDSYQLQVPYDFVDQFGLGHRRRIIDQIQHIENQLEAFKQRLLHPPSSGSLPPSSPSPSL